MMMNNFLKKQTISIILIISIISIQSCGLRRNSFENYSSTINETLNPKNSNLKEIQDIFDVRDMRGCGFDIELGVWYKEKRKNREVWVRRVANYNHGIIGSGNDYLDFDEKDSTPHLTKTPLHHIIYIGEWHFAKRVGKEIRFVAYTGIGGGDIRSQFESKTKENENIPSKPFSLPPKGTTASRTTLCTTKWIANHGYNAISTVKSKNPFSKNYMVPTGEIIEVED